MITVEIGHHITSESWNRIILDLDYVEEINVRGGYDIYSKSDQTTPLFHYDTSEDRCRLYDFFLGMLFYSLFVMD